MKTKKITQRDYIKAHRKASREAEIENHNHPVSFNRIHKSKKVYDRKRNKAEDKKALPYLFLYPWHSCKIDNYNKVSLNTADVNCFINTINKHSDQKEKAV